MRFPKGGLFFLLILLSPLLAVAQQTSVPRPSGAYVTDLAHVLSASERQALNEKLRTYEDTTSTQIVIVTLATLQNISPAEMATEIGQQWRVGQQGQDNGVVLLVVRDDRDVFIATGYGLEGAIPDAIASRIVRDIIVPSFRQNQFYAGLNRATDALIDAARGEYVGRGRGTASSDPAQNRATIFILLIIAFFVLNSFRGGHGGGHMAGGKRYRRGAGIPPVIIFGSGMGGRRGGGGFGGGFGGGGFSGGGGGFGGGGAGGSW